MSEQPLTVNLDEIDTCPECGGPAIPYPGGKWEALTDSEADAAIAGARATEDRLRKALEQIREWAVNPIEQTEALEQIVALADGALEGEAGMSGMVPQRLSDIELGEYDTWAERGVSLMTGRKPTPDELRRALRALVQDAKWQRAKLQGSVMEANGLDEVIDRLHSALCAIRDLVIGANTIAQSPGVSAVTLREIERLAREALGGGDGMSDAAIGDRVQIVSFDGCPQSPPIECCVYDRRHRRWEVAPDVTGTLIDVRSVLGQTVYEVDVVQEVQGYRRTATITRRLLASAVVSVAPIEVGR